MITHTHIQMPSYIYFCSNVPLYSEDPGVPNDGSCSCRMHGKEPRYKKPLVYFGISLYGVQLKTHSLYRAFVGKARVQEDTREFSSCARVSTRTTLVSTNTQAKPKISLQCSVIRGFHCYFHPVS